MEEHLGDKARKVGSSKSSTASEGMERGLGFTLWCWCWSQRHIYRMRLLLCAFSLEDNGLWEILRKHDVFYLQNTSFLETPKHLWGLQTRIQRTSQGKSAVRALINTNSGRSHYFQPEVWSWRIEVAAQEGFAEKVAHATTVRVFAE